jgi:hypothetical protein
MSTPDVRFFTVVACTWVTVYITTRGRGIHLAWSYSQVCILDCPMPAMSATNSITFIVPRFLEHSVQDLSGSFVTTLARHNGQIVMNLCASEQKSHTIGQQLHEPLRVNRMHKYSANVSDDEIELLERIERLLNDDDSMCILR